MRSRGNLHWRCAIIMQKTSIKTDVGSCFQALSIFTFFSNFYFPTFMFSPSFIITVNKKWYFYSKIVFLSWEPYLKLKYPQEFIKFCNQFLFNFSREDLTSLDYSRNILLKLPCGCAPLSLFGFYLVHAKKTKVLPCDFSICVVNYCWKEILFHFLLVTWTLSIKLQLDR